MLLRWLSDAKFWMHLSNALNDRSRKNGVIEVPVIAPVGGSCLWTTAMRNHGTSPSLWSPRNRRNIPVRGALAFGDAVQAARFKSPRPTRVEPMGKR